MREGPFLFLAAVLNERLEDLVLQKEVQKEILEFRLQFFQNEIRERRQLWLSKIKPFPYTLGKFCRLCILFTLLAVFLAIVRDFRRSTLAYMIEQSCLIQKRSRSNVWKNLCVSCKVICIFISSKVYLSVLSFLQLCLLIIK